MVRRISFVLALCFIMVLVFIGVQLYGSLESGYARAVLPVEASTLPSPPNLPTMVQQPDMERVWDAAIAQDRPDLRRRSRPAHDPADPRHVAGA
jgi:hypothetical protein